jgi:endonuclease/exonuclease/phosphatase (EEP) superfamily protein YafD
MVMFTRLAILFLLLVTLLPFVPVGKWWVRLCDFPRLQIGAAGALPLLSLSWWANTSGWTLEHSCWLLLCVAICSWQFGHMLPYVPGWRKQLPDKSDEEPPSTTVCAMNLKFENDRTQEVVEQLRALDPDILLLIEVNQAWDVGLEPLKSRYAHRVGPVLEDGLGLVLWSKLPLIAAEVKYLVSEERPSIFAQVRLRDERVIHLVGLHPTPPGLWDDQQAERHDSRIRDAELLLVADVVAREPELDWLITGDFNDVAWSHTTRLFQRVSGLKDPRVGRGLYNTYHAQYPGLRFPIDHLYLSSTARVEWLKRWRPAGSDHFALAIAFCVTGRVADLPEPVGGDREQAMEMISEGVQDARRSDESETN